MGRLYWGDGNLYVLLLGGKCYLNLVATEIFFLKYGWWMADLPTQANMRLQGDISEDPVFPKVQIWNLETILLQMNCWDVKYITVPHRWCFLRENSARNVMVTLKVCITNDQGWTSEVTRKFWLRSTPSTKYFPSVMYKCFKNMLPRHFCQINLFEGLNLWDEFDRARVLDFLRQLYSQNRLLQQVS